jgi:hypothetical protein
MVQTMTTFTNFKLAFAVASFAWVAGAPMAFAQSPPPQLVTNGPRVSPGDEPGSGAAGRNVADSRHYEQALQANTAFREQRTRKECGVIDDRKLHEQCVASFH